jgi:hypothetical protein
MPDDKPQESKPQEQPKHPVVAPREPDYIEHGEPDGGRETRRR